MTYLKTATEIVKKIQSYDHICYFAGGWVRDFIMNHPSDDIDIVTDAPIELLQKIFPKTIPVGIAFGILIIVENNHPFEIAIFRKENTYSDGRRPDQIEKATPEEDACRRDFTINGLFFDPISKELYDFVNGQQDIRHKLIRAIGDPKKRFQEDRLRMIRAIRYSARFHFTIDANTYAAIKELSSLLFPAVAIERVYNEFEKMAKYPNFDRALIQLHGVGLLKEIFPSVYPLSETILKEHVQYLPFFPPNTPVILKILELFTSLSEEEKILLCEYLKLSNTDKKLVSFQHTCNKMLCHNINEIEDYDWAHLYAKADFELCYQLFCVKLPENERESFRDEHSQHQLLLKKFIERIKQNNLVISSADLLENGRLPNQEFGKLLEKGNRIAMNQKIEDKHIILSMIL
ncbi:MAG: CCA tRNA nucleotidyltransferase [Chlamydiales bacterium]|nr:CCA tRNA nucleotidyltransferase [Chlamydiales bacterium]